MSPWIDWKTYSMTLICYFCILGQPYASWVHDATLYDFMVVLSKHPLYINIIQKWSIKKWNSQHFGVIEKFFRKLLSPKNRTKTLFLSFLLSSQIEHSFYYCLWFTQLHYWLWAVDNIHFTAGKKSCHLIAVKLLEI